MEWLGYEISSSILKGCEEEPLTWTMIMMDWSVYQILLLLDVQVYQDHEKG